MTKYQQYMEYKDSGVEWLEHVPKEWDIIKIKHLSSVKRGASPRPIDDPKYFDDNGKYAWVRIADVSASDTYLHSTTQTMSDLGSSLSVKLEPNELFLSIAGTVGRPCINKIKACIHDGFVYFPDLKIPNKFLFYVFAGEQAYKGLGKMGTQLNLNTDTVGDIKVALPKSVEDIQTIVNFLDHETAKIDHLIEKQQQLIELLKEKRQAVISHAVTKGLDSNVPMKDSGVAWLGEVPEHWTVSRYKYCTSRVVVGIAEAATHAYSEKGIPIIRATNIKEEGININDTLYLKESFANMNEGKYLYTNDIITVRTGYPGISAVIPETLDKSHCFTNLVSTPKSSHCPHFLNEYLNSRMGKAYFALFGWGSAQKNISVPILQEFPIAYPELAEQKEIVVAVQNEKNKFNLLISNAQNSIKLMQERRTALIFAAVTGKIDVRNWQNPTEAKMEFSA